MKGQEEGKMSGKTNKTYLFFTPLEGGRFKFFCLPFVSLLTYLLAIILKARERIDGEDVRQDHQDLLVLFTARGR